MRTSMRLRLSRPVHRQPLEPAICARLVDSDHATAPAGVRSPCAGRTQAAQLGHRLSHSIVCADSHDPVLRRPLSPMRSGNGQGSSSTSIAIHSSHGCSSHRRKRSLMPCSTPTSTSGGAAFWQTASGVRLRARSLHNRAALVVLFVERWEVCDDSRTGSGHHRCAPEAASTYDTRRGGNAGGAIVGAILGTIVRR